MSKEQEKSGIEIAECQRFQELTKKLQTLDDVFEAFGEPDDAPGCGIIVDRSKPRPKPKPTCFARLLGLVIGDRSPSPPEWASVRDGPRWIYTRLSDTVDLHFAIDVDGRVAFKCFGKGQDDGGYILSLRPPAK